MEILHLQGIGKRAAMKAKELKPGMITIGNYGYKEKIENITSTKSGKSIKCEITCLDSGKTLTRTLRVDSLVAIEQKNC